MTSYAYDANGRRAAEITPVGATNGFAYNDRDDVTALTNELGFTGSTTYNSFSQPLVLIDLMGFGTTNGYDSKGNLIATTNAASVIARFGYDTQGNRTVETNAFGLAEQTVTLYKYDQFGYLTNVTDALGNTSAFTYDANGNRLTLSRQRTLANGSKQTLLISNSYDAANRVFATVEPDGFTNRTVYNNIGKTAYSTNKAGVVTRSDYDARGLLTNTVFALGTAQQAAEQNAYDAEGRRTTFVNRAGQPTSYTYDGVGRLRRTTNPDGTYSDNQYDAGGRVFATIQGPHSLGGPTLPTSAITTRYKYDAAGRRTAVITALSQTNRYTFDANGNQNSFIDALNRTNTYSYDRLNRQVKITYQNQSSDSFAYDGLNRRIAVTNQAGVVLYFGYDALLRLTAATNGVGTGASNWLTYAYDEAGNQTNQVDSLNRRTLIEYDAMSRPVRKVQPGSQAELFAYDALGNVIRYTNFNGVVLTNQYDSLNRITNKSSGGGYNLAFTYTATGKRATMTDASGSYTYAYDSNDRLATNSGPAGRLVYSYDLFGHLQAVQSSRSGGAAVTYNYDVLNRLSNVVDSVIGTTVYGFDPVGNLQTLLYPNGVTNTYVFDSLNRLTNLTAKTASGSIGSFAYKVEAAGNRTNLIETVNGSSRTFAWSYNAVYRLTNETITGAAPTGTISYKYDAAGNRTNRLSSVSGVTATTASYNTNDWLASDVSDSNGNTRTNGANAFFYDAENRLTNATIGASTFAYTYNADGIRISKTTGGTTTLYLVDDQNPSGFAQVLEELTVSGGVTNLAKVYTYGLDLVAQRDATSGLRTFYGYDGSGNARYLTTTNGTVSDTYVYDAFGIVLASTGTTPNSYRYAGEQYDSDLGLTYLRARYLNAGTGRFWTRDQVEQSRFVPGSLHKYTYARNNPVNNSDPSGNTEFTIGGLLTSIAIQATVGALVSGSIDYAIHGDAKRALRKAAQGAVIGGTLGGLFYGGAWLFATRALASTATAATAIEIADGGILIGIVKGGQVVKSALPVASHAQLAQEAGLLVEPGVLAEGAEAFTVIKEGGKLIIYGSNNFGSSGKGVGFFTGAS